jgi:hypothetical protein
MWGRGVGTGVVLGIQFSRLMLDITGTVTSRGWKGILGLIGSGMLNDFLSLIRGIFIRIMRENASWLGSSRCGFLIECIQLTFPLDGSYYSRVHLPVRCRDDSSWVT